MKKSIPRGYQFFPPNFTGASNELAIALLPKAISATKTGRQTISTMNIYKTIKAAPPRLEMPYMRIPINCLGRQHYQQPQE